jgi:hypothetical protein
MFCHESFRSFANIRIIVFYISLVLHTLTGIYLANFIVVIGLYSQSKIVYFFPIHRQKFPIEGQKNKLEIDKKKESYIVEAL